MIRASDRPRIKHHFTVIAHGEDIVELRDGVWNATSITLTDESGQGKLLHVIDRLDGSATVAEVAADVGAAEKDVLQICDQLQDALAVELTPASALDHYVSSLMLTKPGTDSRTAPRSGAPQQAVVMGDGDVAAQVRSQLKTSLDVSVVDFTDEKLWHRLCHEDLTSREGDGLRSERLLDEFRMLEGSFVVLALDLVNPILLRNLNRVAVGLGTPWIHAAPDGPFLIVGPTIVPGHSACYECFEHRMAFNLRQGASYASYKKALALGKAKLGRSIMPAPIYSLVASVASLEAINYIVTGSTFTIGKVLTIYLPTLEFCFHEVLRLPSCRVCVARRERYQGQLHFDVRSYLNDVVVASDNGAGG